MKRESNKRSKKQSGKDQTKRVRAHRTYFLALNAQSPNLRDIYFYKQTVSDG